MADAAGRAVRRVEGVAADAERALAPVGRLEPVLSAAADGLPAERLPELLALLDRLPALVGQLEVVGPDVRSLLDRVDDLHALAVGLPGTRRLLRRTAPGS